MKKRCILAVQVAVVGVGVTLASSGFAAEMSSLGEVQPFVMAQAGGASGAAPKQQAQVAQAGAVEKTALEQRREAETALTPSQWAITPHRPTYILPFTYNNNTNNAPYKEADPNFPDIDETEAKYQISFKFPVWQKMFGSNADLYFAYTQISMWQVYNKDNSSPFRDTNYEPEAVVVLHTDNDIFGFKNRTIGFGLVHQSNGRGGQTLSRSWNRVYAAGTLEKGNFVTGLKVWYRIPEDEKEPGSSEGDDNPDIEDYMGYGELRAGYKLGNNVFASMVRYNMLTDHPRGAVEADWSFPLYGKLKGYVQGFYGYGESLIDYNHRNERIGIGILLSDWM